MKTYWWIWITASGGCGSNLMWPGEEPTLDFSVEEIAGFYGFPTQEEARDAQYFLLHADIDALPAVQRDWCMRPDIKVVPGAGYRSSH